MTTENVTEQAFSCVLKGESDAIPDLVAGLTGLADKALEGFLNRMDRRILSDVLKRALLDLRDSENRVYLVEKIIERFDDEGGGTADADDALALIAEVVDVHVEPEEIQSLADGVPR